MLFFLNIKKILMNYSFESLSKKEMILENYYIYRLMDKIHLNEMIVDK